jgi:hypothetical protein
VNTVKEYGRNFFDFGKTTEGYEIENDSAVKTNEFLYQKLIYDTY